MDDEMSGIYLTNSGGEMSMCMGENSYFSHHSYPTGMCYTQWTSGDEHISSLTFEACLTL